MTARDELAERVKGEISHHITPVIGWLRWDAKTGRDDSDKRNLTEYRERLDKAAKAVAALIEPRTITRAKELDALPVGSVVLSEVYHNDVDGMAVSFQRWYDGDWHRGSRCGDTHPDNFLPATVLHEGGPS